MIAACRARGVKVALNTWFDRDLTAHVLTLLGMRVFESRDRIGLQGGTPTLGARELVA